MKGFKKKIMAMALSVMMAVSMFGNIVSADEVNTLQMDTLKYGTQKVTVSVGGVNYYSYTPTKTEKQSFTVKVPEGYVTSAAVFDGDSSSPKVFGPTASESSVDYNFTAGTEYVLAFYVDSRSFASEAGVEANEVTEVEATLTIGEAKPPIYVTERSSKIGDMINVDADSIKGLSWDSSTNTLTMDGYNLEESIIYFNNSDVVPIFKGEKAVIDDKLLDIKSLNKSEYTDGKVSLKEEEDYRYKGTYYDVTLYIKGVNNLKNVSIYVDCGINLTVKGDGELNVQDNEHELFYFSSGAGYIDEETGSLMGGENVDGKFILDGPTINLSGKYGRFAILTPNFEMKSGNIYMDVEPFITSDGRGNDFAVYTGIEGYLSAKVTGGNIVVKYGELPENTEVYAYYNESDGEANYYYPIIVSGDLLIENATVIVTGDMNVAKLIGEPFILEIGDNAGKVDIKDSATYLIGNPIDISKLKVELSETSYDYDGTAKTPSVNVAGLKEGVDFEVAYKNNVEAGTATVTVKGLGCFSGSIDATFEIVKGAVADGPKAGTTIKDKKYVYKVTKAGSKDGSIVGELEVTGLKKKSLTQIKIAAKVKIGGVTYKVTSVGAKAFKGNKKIAKVFVGKNVKEIGANAFAKCVKLKQASINSTVLTSIGKNAFIGDKKLKKVIIKSNKLKKVGKKAFYRKSGKKLTFKVPKARKAKYKKLLKNAKTNKFVVK